MGREVVSHGGLGALVRRRRKELGLTQRELARRTEITQEYISMIETNRKRWPQLYVPVLSRELGISQVEMAVAAGLISDPNQEAQAA